MNDNIKWLIDRLYENIRSLQERIEDLNSKGHIDVKNINDIKSLSGSLCNYVRALECSERISRMNDGDADGV